MATILITRPNITEEEREKRIKAINETLTLIEKRRREKTKTNITKEENQKKIR